MIELSINRVFEIEQRMAAFTNKALQTVSVYFKWGQSLGYSIDELIQFADINVFLVELRAIGYFSPVTFDKEHLKQIKAMERGLPKWLRQQLRNARLSKSTYGKVHPHGG